MPELKFDLPKNQSSIIKVLGIGGGGSNAVSHMFKQGIRDVDFVICNTDAQSLDRSSVPTKVRLGSRGLGAGNIPEVGRQATLENIEEIKALLDTNTQMLFITAGMGGGTGTGGAPVIAQAAREMDILTVGIVTMPFSFEGRKRKQQAEEGIAEMRKYVDTLLVINNDKLRELFGNLKLSEAFGMADDVLSTASKGIAEIITVPGYVNVDFEDVKTVIKNSGKAILGSGMAEGAERAEKAVKIALASPLLDDNHINGARNVLLYITSGKEEISMDEVSEITDYIQQEAGQQADIVWGNGTDESLGNKICVTVIATGFDAKKQPGQTTEKIVVGCLSEPSQPVAANLPLEANNNVLQATDSHVVATPKAQTESMTTKTVSIDDKIAQITASLELNGHRIPAAEPAVPATVEQPIFALSEKTSSPVQNSSVNAGGVGQPEMTKQLNEERKQRLRELSLKYKLPGGLLELEKEPAYVRRNVELNDLPATGTSQISRYILSADEDASVDLKKNNSFLHDNVD